MSYGHWLQDSDLDNVDVLMKILNRDEIYKGKMLVYGPVLKVEIIKYPLQKQEYFILMFIHRDLSKAEVLSTGDCAQRFFDDINDRDNYCERLKNLLISKGFDASISEQDYSEFGTMSESDVKAIENLSSKSS